MTRCRCVATLFLALAVGWFAAAQDAKPVVDAKAFDKLVVDSLRAVHNKGADLYNETKDFAGAYRMYQGALVAVKPLLGHRPAVQKMIDDGLTAAEKDLDMARRAFLLHETIEAARKELKTGLTEMKTPDPKPTDPPEKKEKEAKPKNAGGVPIAAGGPGLFGIVTLKGQPLPGGDVIFVSLDQPVPRVFTAAVQDNGRYAPMEVVPDGKYVVTVNGPGVPEPYKTTTTSPLRAEITMKPFRFDIELK